MDAEHFALSILPRSFGRFIVGKPLTASQLSRLPDALKARGSDGSLGFLARLYGLEDPRPRKGC